MGDSIDARGVACQHRSSPRTRPGVGQCKRLRDFTASSTEYRPALAESRSPVGCDGQAQGTVQRPVSGDAGGPDNEAAGSVYSANPNPMVTGRDATGGWPWEPTDPPCLTGPRDPGVRAVAVAAGGSARGSAVGDRVLNARAGVSTTGGLRWVFILLPAAGIMTDV